MKTEAEYHHKFVTDAIKAKSRRLRDLADRIERDATADLERAQSGKSTYGCAVANLLHELAWGVANLNIEMMVRMAADADIHAATVKASKGEPA